jgi:hypothetical protein
MYLREALTGTSPNARPFNAVRRIIPCTYQLLGAVLEHHPLQQFACDRRQCLQECLQLAFGPVEKPSAISTLSRKNGGDGGIRTLDTSLDV